MLNGTDRSRTDDLLRVKQAQTVHNIGSHGFEPISPLTIPSHLAKIVRKIVRRKDYGEATPTAILFLNFQQSELERSRVRFLPVRNRMRRGAPGVPRAIWIREAWKG
jgi:hypothetical protein